MTSKPPIDTTGLKVNVTLRAPKSHLDALPKGALVRIINAGLQRVDNDAGKLFDLAKEVAAVDGDYTLAGDDKIKTTSTSLPVEPATLLRQVGAPCGLSQDWVVRLFIVAHLNGKLPTD